MPISLEKGALFLADAHFHKGLREDLRAFLRSCQAPQLFLMGDIFDLLVGGVSATIEENREVIELIDSLECEVYYLEGNHDFLLGNLFKKCRVLPRAAQPLIVQADGKRVALAHGDNFIGGLYAFYIATIQRRGVISLLELLNVRGWISKRIQRYNASKRLCKKIDSFEAIAKERLGFYDADIVIEGHYHQAAFYSFDKRTYINLPSYGCDRRVLRYDGEFSFVRM